MDGHTRHPTVLVALTMRPRAALPPIDARVEAMVPARAGAEVSAPTPPARRRPCAQALGFEELLRGDVAAMQLRTRRYAKRQLTWLRKLPGARHLDLTDRTRTTRPRRPRP